MATNMAGTSALQNMMGVQTPTRVRTWNSTPQQQQQQQQNQQQMQPMRQRPDAQRQREQSFNTQAQPQQTFAQMQQAGQARPAPQAQPMPQYAGSQQAQVARDQLQQQVAQAMQSPTRFDTAAYQQMASAARGNINADFDRQRSQLDTEMARRGLYDSTIAAQGWQDLGGQQARALADMDSTLLREAAATQAADRTANANITSQLAQLAGSQDLAAFEANRVGQAMDFENQMRSAEFGEGTRQFDLQQQLAQALGLGGLGLEQQRINQQGSQFGQQMQLSRDELALRGDLGQQEQALARARMEQEGTLAQAQQNIQREQMQQQGSQFEQGLSADTRNQDLNRQLQQILAMGSQDIDRQRLAQEGSQFGQQLGFQREQLGTSTQQSNMDRALREALGLGELGLSQQRLAQEGSQFNQNLQFQGQESQRQRALQQLLQGNELGFNRQQLAQQQGQFERSAQQTDLARALQEQLALGSIGGQNTVERDSAMAQQDLARQNMLGQLLGMLGIGNFNGILGGGSGGSGGGAVSPPPPPPPVIPAPYPDSGYVPQPPGPRGFPIDPYEGYAQ